MPLDDRSLEISPELGKRLQALQALLDIGDSGLVQATATTIGSGTDPHPEIQQLLALIGDLKYAEAKAILDEMLRRGTRLVRWEDPEIKLLENELEELSTALTEREGERAEISRRLSEFNHRFHAALGDLIVKILRHRAESLKRQAESEPSAEEKYEEARQEYEQFEEELAEERLRETHDLSDEERAELKTLYRRCSKLCHPDLVPEEHQEAASRMFRELKKAYDLGDLATVREIQKQVEAGIFSLERRDDTPEARKIRLRGRCAAVRSRLEKVKAEIEGLKSSTAWKTVEENTDLEAYLAARREALEEELEALSAS